MKKQIKSELLLPHELTGKVESPNLIVFIHGYPDTNRLWDDICPEHEKDNLCLKISYPNYDKRVIEPWGRSFNQIVKGIKETIDFVSEDRKYKIFVVSHDWGALFTYLLDKAYPGLISNGVVMDIGYKLDMSFTTVLFMLTYQLYLAIAFLMPRPIGNFLTGLFMNLIKKEYTPKEIDSVDSSMNFLYYQMYRSGFYQFAFIVAMYFLTSTKLIFYSIFFLLLIYKAVTFKTSSPLYRYKPSFPFAFIYGEKKKFMFHNTKMIMDMQENSKNEVHGVKKGHWVMLKNEKMINEIITRRLKDL